tara:strand:- start:15878 stop:16909 length:1032 start_codon:yes stop_codon:yes gene_type:complete
MQPYEREFFIYRIINGYLRIKEDDGEIFNIFESDSKKKYMLSELYVESYKKARELGSYEEDETLDIMLEYGLWDELKESKLKGLPKEIEDMKVRMLENAFKSRTREGIREHVRRAEKQLELLARQKHDLYEYTCAGYANYCVLSKFVETSCFDEENNKCDWNEHSLSEFMSLYQHATIDDKLIRKLSQTEEWRRIWAVSRDATLLFGRQPHEFTNNQTSLILWSRTYDSCHESMETPPEKIINDDDLFDGWLIKQRRKREQDTRKEFGEDAMNLPDADEVFIPVETQSDVEEINNMNDPLVRSVKRQRFKQIEDQGSVHHGDLKDVRRDIQLEANRQQVNAYR